MVSNQIQGVYMIGPRSEKKAKARACLFLFQTAFFDFLVCMVHLKISVLGVLLFKL